MHNLLHWGDQVNWTPIVCLGVAGLLLLLTRLLVVWFYTRRVLTKLGDNADVEAQMEFVKSFSMQKPAVPHLATNRYYLSDVVFIIVALWGAISTAWWMIPSGFIVWIIVHRPFLEVMQSWSQFHNVTMFKDDADALRKGGLTPEQEKAIQKRMGLEG
jgi:hypothetical protein